VVPLGATSVCMSAAQDAADLGTHFEVVALHANIGAQSASLAHTLAQPAPAHSYGAHDAMTASSHAPLPVHLPTVVTTPPAQEAARHVVSGPTKPAHRSRTVPSHAAAPHALRSLAAGHAPWPGAGAPTTGTHVPFASARLHASHARLQSVLQQTPSTQLGADDGHGSLLVHAAPGASCAMHWPLMQ
jgi:hypothetical protein